MEIQPWIKPGVAEYMRSGQQFAFRLGVVGLGLTVLNHTLCDNKKIGFATFVAGTGALCLSSCVGALATQLSSKPSSRLTRAFVLLEFIIPVVATTIIIAAATLKHYEFIQPNTAKIISAIATVAIFTIPLLCIIRDARESPKNFIRLSYEGAKEGAKGIKEGVLKLSAMIFKKTAA